MKRKMDFVLDDDKKFEKITFRFYPKSTHVHSFDENPPKTWKEVYKVYYSWRIFITYYDWDDNLDVRSAKPLFDMPCDECSSIPDLGNGIRYCLNEKKNVNLTGFGQPAGDWNLEYVREYDNVPELNWEGIWFQVWNTGDETGYRFRLDKEKALEFAEFLDKVNAYALEHGEEI